MRLQVAIRYSGSPSVGVGILMAMVFLIELGDLSRFRNRKQNGAFVERFGNMVSAQLA